jgi:flagellar hook protein FlgE
MSLLRAMYTGVSGINAEGEALGVVGDNIANANTIGFKEQRANFEDVLGSTVQVQGPGVTAGAGVRISSVEQMFTQGSLSTTGVSTDLAMNGDGFFVVAGQQNGIDGSFYTRDGQFKLDDAGTLVNENGMKVQGWKANPDGTMGASLGGTSIAFFFLNNSIK